MRVWKGISWVGRAQLTSVDEGKSSRARVGGCIVDCGVEHVGEHDGVGEGDKGGFASKAQIHEVEVKGASVGGAGLRDSCRVQGAAAQVVCLLSLQRCKQQMSACNRVYSLSRTAP